MSRRWLAAALVCAGCAGPAAPDPSALAAAIAAVPDPVAPLSSRNLGTTPAEVARSAAATEAAQAAWRRCLAEEAVRLGMPDAAVAACAGRKAGLIELLARQLDAPRARGIADRLEVALRDAIGAALSPPMRL